MRRREATASPTQRNPAAPLRAPSPAVLSARSQGNVGPRANRGPPSAPPPLLARYAPRSCCSYLQSGRRCDSGRTPAFFYPRRRAHRLPIAAAGLGWAGPGPPLPSHRGGATEPNGRSQAQPGPRSVHRHTPRAGSRPIGRSREERAELRSHWQRGEAAARPAEVV